MKVTPIIMSSPMVRALLEGRKTQTRRIIRLPTSKGEDRRGKWEACTIGGAGCFDRFRNPVPEEVCISNDRVGTTLVCPYGRPPDALLYVRENVWLPREASPRELRDGADTWQPDFYADGITCFDIEQYKQWGWKPTPSIHMPRRVSRLTLQLSDVRVERLNDISEEDKIAEGATTDLPFGSIFERIHGPQVFTENPWLWVLSFRVHQVNIDIFLKTHEAAA